MRSTANSARWQAADDLIVGLDDHPGGGSSWGDDEPEAGSVGTIGAVGNYVSAAAQQVVLGKYNNGQSNALGTGAELGLAFSGLDLPGDLRDLWHDLSNWK